MAAAELEARLRGMALDDVEAAISGGDVEAVRRWLETGGDVNAKGDSAGNWSLLYEACVNSVRPPRGQLAAVLERAADTALPAPRALRGQTRLSASASLRWSRFRSRRAATHLGGAADRGRGSTHPGRAPERYAQPGDATLRPARAFGVERSHLLGLGARPGLLS